MKLYVLCENCHHREFQYYCHTKDICYYKKAQAEEVAAVEKRNLWLKKLRDSLKKEEA